jgi:5-methyltetrahydrofolate--homocysteine methyltransferase
VEPDPAYKPAKPAQLGVQSFDIDLAELVDYIDWGPFFQTWDLAGSYPKILDDEIVGETARELKSDAEVMLARMVAEQDTNPWVAPRRCSACSRPTRWATTSRSTPTNPAARC